MKYLRSLSLMLLVMASLSPTRADASATTQSPVLTRSKAVELNGQQGGNIEYVSIDDEISITLQSCSNISIYCSNLHSIKLAQCSNITIQNCWIHDCKANGVEAWACKNIRIEGCRLERVTTGVWAVDSQDVQFIGNYAENMRGPMPRGQMIQFDNVTGAHNLIKDNYCVNFQGQSHPEDCINIFHSKGDSQSPIVIEDNYLVGDPVKGSAGKSASGSGIMLGDNDENGGGGGGNQICRNNIVINAGQVGIGVAGGDAIRVEHNIVIGTKSDVSNVGIYAWNQAKAPGGTVTLSGNQVYWINKNEEHTSWWQGAGFTKVDLQGNKFDDQALVTNPLPAPPTQAPMPPAPVTRNGVIEVPWKP